MKKIIIAGAGKGIGLSLAKKLAGDNELHIITRSASDALTGIKANIQYADLSTDSWMNDITVPDTVDGLVYCPGSINLKPFNRLTTQDFTDDFRQNVLGAIHLIQKCLPALKRSEHASVVLFSSVAAKTGMTFHSSVAVSKSAVEGLVRSLAAEFAGSNIRFNAIAPSLTETALASNLINTAEKKEAAAKRHPLQRIGNPEEVAALAAFLLSDEAGWITGQVINIDGGMGSLK